MDDRMKEGSYKAPRGPEHPRETGDEVGEAAGGISGVVVGAAIGSLGGPVGAVIGGIAGAVGGWWAGRAVADAAQEYSVGDEAVYRNHFDNSPNRLADRKYESVSPAYQIGHIAARNPDYQGRTFDEIEPDIERGWIKAAAMGHDDWHRVRDYARDAYDRSANGVERERLRSRSNLAADEADKRLDSENDLDLI